MSREKTVEEILAALAEEARVNYLHVKANCLADGMVEVEPGHFVRPGEWYIDTNGVRHDNRTTLATSPSPSPRTAG